MGLTKSVYDKLAERKNYGLTSSWAIWDPAAPTDTRFIAEQLTCFKTSVVMVALNCSVDGRIKEAWQNFHSGTDHARKLMYAFNESPYRGAYMTDIIKGEVCPNSKELMKRLKDEKVVGKHIDSFRDEMESVGVDKSALFILFGDNVHALFTEYLASDYPNHVKCRHYSSTRTSDTGWVEEAWSVLTTHSQKTKSTFNTLEFVRNDQMEKLFEELKNRRKQSKNRN
jgi:hypothetical protein